MQRMPRKDTWKCKKEKLVFFIDKLKYYYLLF